MMLQWPIEEKAVDYNQGRHYREFGCGVDQAFGLGR